MLSSSEPGKFYLVDGSVEELNYYLEVGQSISAQGIFISEYIEPHFNLGMNIPAMQLSNIPWIDSDELPENNCLQIVEGLQKVAFTNDEIVVTDSLFFYYYKKLIHKVSMDFSSHKYSLYVDFARTA